MIKTTATRDHFRHQITIVERQKLVRHGKGHALTHGYSFKVKPPEEGPWRPPFCAYCHGAWYDSFDAALRAAKAYIDVGEKPLYERHAGPANMDSLKVKSPTPPTIVDKAKRVVRRIKQRLKF